MASRTTEVINALQKAHFVYLRRNRHMVWGCPCGHGLITIATTKQTGSGDTAAYALIARILRECEQRRKDAA